MVEGIGIQPYSLQGEIKQLYLYFIALFNITPGFQGRLPSHIWPTEKTGITKLDTGPPV